MIDIFLKILNWRIHFGILQLNEYQYFRYLKWLINNPFKTRLPEKKKFTLTSKVLILTILSLFWTLLISYFIILNSSSLLISVLLILIITFSPFIQIALSLITLKPYEVFNRKRVINKTRDKIMILKKRGLKIIAITGSYGKTSTKEFLYQLLKTKYKTLKTPESYNTVFGISKVVDYELDQTYEYFICEMAAYKPGEIKELCNMVLPDYGLITGITNQHLERFKSLKNIIKTKFELFDYINNPKFTFFNLSDENILKELNDRKIKKALGYGSYTGEIKISKIKFDSYGSSITLKFKKDYKLKTKLFGYANLQNLLASVYIAYKLNIPIRNILTSVSEIKPFDNRNNLIKQGKCVIVNNTYSSNTQSFLETLKTANSIIGKKALITPGIVELGTDTVKIHKYLADKINDIFDDIILVGKNERTLTLKKYLNKDLNICFIEDNRSEYNKTLNTLSKTHQWIFLENDVTQNY